MPARRLPNPHIPLYTRQCGLWLSRFIPGVYPSGQRGQTVNLMAYAFEGSNPSAPICVNLASRGNPTAELVYRLDTGVSRGTFLSDNI